MAIVNGIQKAMDAINEDIKNIWEIKYESQVGLPVGSASVHLADAINKIQTDITMLESQFQSISTELNSHVSYTTVTS